MEKLTSQRLGFTQGCCPQAKNDPSTYVSMNTAARHLNGVDGGGNGARADSHNGADTLCAPLKCRPQLSSRPESLNQGKKKAFQMRNVFQKHKSASTAVTRVAACRQTVAVLLRAATYFLLKTRWAPPTCRKCSDAACRLAFRNSFCPD